MATFIPGSSDQPAHTESMREQTKPCCGLYPARIVAIALGIILIAGAAIAAWQLNPIMGYKSFYLLGLVPAGILLIAVDTKKILKFFCHFCETPEMYVPTGGGLKLGWKMSLGNEGLGGFNTRSKDELKELLLHLFGHNFDHRQSKITTKRHDREGNSDATHLRNFVAAIRANPYLEAAMNEVVAKIISQNPADTFAVELTTKFVHAIQAQEY